MQVSSLTAVRIENSVTRVTVRHHEAFRVMPNSYPSDGIFNLHRTYGFFFLPTLPLTNAFRLEYALFYDFYAKIFQFAVKKCLVRLLSMTLTSKRLANNDTQTNIISFLFLSNNEI